MDDSTELTDYLRIYYKFLFPYNEFYRWLTYGEGNDYLKRREFSMTLPGEIYLRYLSFGSQDEMVKAIQSKVPEKIDIGAVYNIPPPEGRKGLQTFIPCERELVFDIDINDYDEIRTCCKETQICQKCWLFLAIAAKILHLILTEDFGFKQILYVFSGRRGLHVWVADRRARLLNDKARSAIVSFISLIDGSAYRNKRVEFDGYRALHPSIKKSAEIIRGKFSDIILNNKLFDSKENVEKLLNLCTDLKMKEMLTNELAGVQGGPGIWRSCEVFVEQYLNIKSGDKPKLNNRHLIEEILIQYAYPRLDINVSKSLNHLLKIPFSVHPKTGNICVPIDIEDIYNFKLENVPTVQSLCVQINEFDSQSKLDGNNEKILAPFKTQLKQSIQIFNRFLISIEKEIRINRKQTQIDF